MGTNDKASCLLVIKGRVYDTANELKAKGCSRLELQKIEFLCKRTQFELMYYQWLVWQQTAYYNVIGFHSNFDLLPFRNRRG